MFNPHGHSLNGDFVTYMTPEKQRIAIAEACGWTDDFPTYDKSKGGILLPYRFINKYTGKKILFLPDYLNDLNAIREARKTLTTAQQYVFGERLAEIVLGANEDFTNLSCDRDDFPYMFYNISNATAEQESEAFLKTLNLWKED